MSRPDSWRSIVDQTHCEALVAAWLEKARGGMDLADRELGRGDAANMDAVCYHAQQAAGKLLKAALVARGVDPPKVHDLVHLSGLLERHLLGWGWDKLELSVVSSAAVEVRYPGFSAKPAHARRSFETVERLWIALRPQI